MKKDNQYQTWANGITLFSLLLFIPGALLFTLRNSFANPLLIGWIGIGIITICRLLDLADGYVARRNKEVSKFGAWFDPFVDKIHVYVSLVMLWMAVSHWLFWLLLARDLAKTIVRSHGACNVAAGKSDKVKATLQSIALLPLAIGLLHNISWLIQFGNCLLLVALIYAAVWLVKYARQNPANGMSFVNFSCGFFAVGLAIEEHFYLAVLSIFIGGIADNLDGRIARKLGIANSKFGALLDDYADFCNFGIAPAILATSYASWSLTGVIIGVFYTLATAGRLWHFTVNKDRKPEGFFFGLPSPAGAAIVCATIFLGWESTSVLFATFVAILLMSSFRVLWPHFNQVAATIKKEELILIVGFAFPAVMIFNSPLASLAGMLVVYLLSPLWRKPETAT